MISTKEDEPVSAADRRGISKARYRRLLIAAVAVSMGLKLLSLLFISDDLQRQGLAVWDSQTYYEPAMALLHGQSFHSYVRTPGYPVFLAVIYGITRDPNPVSGLNLISIFLVQAALLSFGCVLIAASVVRLTGDRRLALLGAFLWALNNSARLYSIIMLTEALASFLMCVLVYCLSRIVIPDPIAAVSAPARDPDRSKLGRESRTPSHPSGYRPGAGRLVWYVTAGAAMFYLALTRPSAALLPVPFAAGVALYQFLIVRQRCWRAYVPAIVLLLVLPLSAPLLWAWRNQRVEGQWYYCRLSVYGTYNFGFYGPVAASEGKDPYLAMDASFAEFLRLLDKTSPQAMDRMYRDRIVALVRSHPRAVAENVLKGVAYLFLPSFYKVPGGHYRDSLRPAFWRSLPPSRRAVYAFHLVNTAFEFVSLVAMMGLILMYVASRGRARPIDPARAVDLAQASGPTGTADSSRRGFMACFLILLAFWILFHVTVAWYAFARFLLPFVPFIIVAAMIAASERRRPAVGSG